MTGDRKAEVCFSGSTGASAAGGVFLASFDERHGQAADVFRVFAQGARADDRIVRVDVDIDDWSVGHVNSHRSGLGRGYFAHLIGQVVGVCRAQGHERWK